MNGIESLHRVVGSILGVELGDCWDTLEHLTYRGVQENLSDLPAFSRSLGEAVRVS